jgi:hypothetical protein
MWVPPLCRQIAFAFLLLCDYRQHFGWNRGSSEHQAITLTTRSAGQFYCEHYPSSEIGFLRSRQLCSYPRISQNFMEPYGSLSCSQEPSTSLYPEPDQSSTYHIILSKIDFNIVHHLCLGLPSGLFPSGFPTIILYAFLFSPIRTTFPTHSVFLDLIILITFGEEYKLWSRSLCSIHMFRELSLCFSSGTFLHNHVYISSHRFQVLFFPYRNLKLDARWNNWHIFLYMWIPCYKSGKLQFTCGTNTSSQNWL